VPVAAVLGWPLLHTLSPRLHQAAYRAAGLDDWRYLARPTPPQELAAVLREVRSGALAGVNLTTPHKEAAVPLLDTLEPPADTLGAVNTVWRSDSDGLTGGNTDVAGALWALELQVGLAGDGWDGSGPVLLLGTGGVALAVALAWARLAAARRRRGLGTCALTVAGRSRERAARVAGRAGPDAVVIGWAEVAPAVAAANVLVQATTLTARGEPVPGQNRLRPGARVLDLNYGPSSQGLVSAARLAGAAVAVDGLGMLCAQAAEAVLRMTGIRPDFAAMAAAAGLAAEVGPGVQAGPGA
jgi:shikimate dehydrogenase